MSAPIQSWWRVGAHTDRIVEIAVVRILPTRLVLADGSEVVRDDPAVSYWPRREQAAALARERLVRGAALAREAIDRFDAREAQLASQAISTP